MAAFSQFNHHGDCSRPLEVLGRPATFLRSHPDRHARARPWLHDIDRHRALRLRFLLGCLAGPGAEPHGNDGTSSSVMRQIEPARLHAARAIDALSHDLSWSK